MGLLEGSAQQVCMGTMRRLHPKLGCRLLRIQETPGPEAKVAPVAAPASQTRDCTTWLSDAPCRAQEAELAFPGGALRGVSDLNFMSSPGLCFLGIAPPGNVAPLPEGLFRLRLNPAPPNMGWGVAGGDLET